MNPATHGMEGNATAPVLYMALELSNKNWRLAFCRLGRSRRRHKMPSRELSYREKLHLIGDRFWPKAGAQTEPQPGCPCLTV